MTRMKLNHILAAALVAAASVPAVAAIALPNTGNGELFLVVWDQADLVSYTKDLGIFMNDFNPNAPLTFALNDANFTGFLAVADNTVPDFSDLRFAVMAGDSEGSRRIYTTVDSTATTTPMNNGQLTAGTGWMNNYANNQVTTSQNTTHAGAASVNGTSFDVSPNFAYFGTQNGSTFQNTNLTWNNASVVGTQAVFRSFTTGGSGAQSGTATGQLDLAFASLNQTPAGAFSVSVTPVPEAEGIAMALAGLGALGFVARRRRQS